MFHDGYNYTTGKYLFCPQRFNTRIKNNCYYIGRGDRQIGNNYSPINFNLKLPLEASKLRSLEAWIAFDILLTIPH